MRLSHVRLLVSNMQQSYHFYHHTLGFELLWGDENSPYVELNTGGSIIALNQREIMKDVLPIDFSETIQPHEHKSILIFEVEDVDGYINNLRSEGISILTNPIDMPQWGIRLAHIQDPDGNIIEINKPFIPYE